MGYISLIETAPNITSENKTPKFAARNLPRRHFLAVMILGKLSLPNRRLVTLKLVF